MSIKINTKEEMIVIVITLFFVFGFYILNVNSITGMVIGDFSIRDLAQGANYNLRMYTLGLQANEAEGSVYEARTLLTAFQPGFRNAQGSTYSSNIGFFSAPVEAVTPAAPTGGISRGGVKCVYDWECTEWFPRRCPEEGIQKRMCYNRGSCSGLNGKPDELRKCSPEVKGPLFDLFMEILKEYKQVLPGEKISADLKLVNVGDVIKLDIYLKYWIVDVNDTLIYEKQETRSIEQGIDFNIDVDLPENIKQGMHRLYTQVTYDIDERIALGGDSFEVVLEKPGGFDSIIIISLFGIVSLIGIIFVIHELRLKGQRYKIRL